MIMNRFYHNQSLIVQQYSLRIVQQQQKQQHQALSSSLLVSVLYKNQQLTTRTIHNNAVATIIIPKTTPALPRTTSIATTSSSSVSFLFRRSLLSTTASSPSSSTSSSSSSPTTTATASEMALIVARLRQQLHMSQPQSPTTRINFLQQKYGSNNNNSSSSSSSSFIHSTNNMKTNESTIILNALKHGMKFQTADLFDWILFHLYSFKTLFNILGTMYCIYIIQYHPGVIPFGFLLPQRFYDAITTIPNEEPTLHQNENGNNMNASQNPTTNVVRATNYDHRTTHCEGIPTGASTSSSSTTTTTSSATLTPSFVDKLDIQTLVDRHNDETNLNPLPIFTLDELAQYNGTNPNQPIYMSYGGYVYDVTNFIHNHPGGADKIMQAAGTAIEPYWYIYRQHFNSELPMKLMEQMIIGQLHEKDQTTIDEQMMLLEEENDDPYAHEPVRNKLLKVLIDTPMSAEVPSNLLTQSYITPNDLFYVRNHHPVPYLTEKDIQNFRLQIDLSALLKEDTTSSSSSSNASTYIKSFTLQDIYNMPSTDVIVTLQCSGNRRSGYNSHLRTSGTPWGQGAISTAKFTGVKLRDVLLAAGITDPVLAQEKYGIEHIRFYALDDMCISIDIEKAMNVYGDCIIAYKMNDEPIPRDHGYPLRLIVPGYSGVRNLKWINRIELSSQEAEGVWHRGLNYKPLPPGITDASTVDLTTIPSISELSLYSGITRIERKVSSGSSSQSIHPGDRVTITVGGWAFGGGGRNIVRVDVTGDNGTTWSTASLKEGSQQRFKRAWAWTFWECDVEAVVNEDGSVHVASKAVDMAYNVQPESNIHMWNVRGLNNNSWYRAHAKVLD